MFYYKSGAEVSVILSADYVFCWLMQGGETDLRGNIIRGPAERSRGNTFKYALLAHAKICQFAVTVFVKKNIVQLQIPEKKGKRKKEQIDEVFAQGLLFSTYKSEA